MVVLFNPPSSASRKPILPMSLLALGAQLEGRREYRIVDGNLEQNPLEAIEAALEQLQATILGVTVMPGPQLGHSLPICRELKRRHPALKIVWGGYFPSQHYEPCLRSGAVDYVVRGCGERPFVELVDALLGGGDLSAVPSIGHLDRSADEIVLSPMAAMPDPERLPPYPYHRVEVDRYLRSTFMGRRTMSHCSSYGCPFACDFCAVASTAKGRWRAESGARLVETVRGLVGRYGVDSVEFFDNSFFIDEERVRTFAAGIDDLGLGWWAEARIDVLERYSESSWQRLRDSGLKMVFMGAESGSNETLRRMNKGGGASVDATLAVVEQTRRFGIVPELSFVMGAPPDPEADVRQTIDFIRRLKRVNPAAEIVMYMYTPVASAGELFAEAEQRGFRFPATLEEWTSPRWSDFAQRRDLRVPWLGRSLRRKVREFECVLNAFYPTVTNPRLAGLPRWLCRGLSGWRYHLGIYRAPLELLALQKLLRYQRPETSGL